MAAFLRFGDAKPETVSRPAPSTHGELVYAIGDVHGRLDLLETLVRGVLDDSLQTRPARRPILVLLGDYIDRGPDSAGVIRFLTRLAASRAVALRPLRGNHEQALLSFLADPASGEQWVAFGGGATLASYAVRPPAPGADPSAWVQARDDFAVNLPTAHRRFLEGLEHMLVVGDYVFVHAGVRTGEPLDRQTAEDVLWIRDEFLSARTPAEKMVVHGHTPVEEPERTPYRLGIDTGAVSTGVLTAIRLYDREQQVIQVRTT